MWAITPFGTAVWDNAATNMMIAALCVRYYVTPVGPEWEK